MNRAVVSRVFRTLTTASLAAPLLATYLYFSTCGGGRTGFVMTAKAFGVSVSAAYCSAG